MNIVLCIFALCFPLYIRAEVRGSNTDVSVQSFHTFSQYPALGIDNEMRGFGWFKNGFALQNSGTECIFDSVYPVSGTINLNGGTLKLSQDLLFKNIVDLQGWGVVQGNNYAVDFCSSVTTLPSDADSFDNTTIFINNDLTLTSTLTFKNNCTIVGNGNTIFLSTDGGLLVDSGADLLLRNVTIRDISNGNILCIDDTSKLRLDTVKWYQSGDYTFLNGSIEFIDHVGFFGDYTFAYDSSQTSTVDAHATWQIFDDMIFCIGRSALDSVEPLYMQDQTAELRMSNCHLHINPNGIEFTRGKLIFDDIVQLDDDSTSTANGMQLGNGNADDDPILEFDVGASVLLKSSHLVFDTVSPNIIKTGAHKGGRLKRFVGSNIYLKKDLTLPSMSLEADSLLIPPIALADDVTLEYDDTLVVLPNAVFDITSARRDTYTYQLNGNDSIFLTKGTFPLSVNVENTGNTISGNGSVAGAITFANQDAQLILDLQGFIEGPIVLNNGSIVMNGDIKMGTDASITGSGSIVMNDKALHLPYLDIMWTGTLECFGQNASVDLHSQLTLKSTITVSGDVIIDGNGNVLDLCDTGNIYIKDGSTLSLKDIYVKNLKESKVTCESDNCTIIVDNAFINLSDNCTFDKGSILFRNNVDIVGTYTFTYESSQTSTIDSGARLRITDDSKFIIGRHEISQAEPIFFQDETSVLHMNNCYMYVTCCGAHFTNGTLLCDNDVMMEIEGTTTDKGLELGNGQPDDTMKVVLNAGTSVRNLGGIIVYNIGNPYGFVSNSRSTQLIRSPSSATYMKTGIVFSDITIRILDTPNLSTPAQNTILYENAGIDLPVADFIITGKRYTNSSNLLGGGGEVFMNRGTYPFGTFVLNSDNIIRGNGAIGGPIIFLNPTAELEWLLNGALIGNMKLNGGTVRLGSDMHLARGTQINNGTIDLRSNSIVFGTQDLTITQNNYFDGDGGAIELCSNIVLDASWTFSQNCILNGNGYKFTLGSSGALLVENGSTLRIRNIRLQGISENNIRCLDDNGALILDNVYWHQSSNFAHTAGALEYYNFIEMDSDFPVAFAYQSCHTSTIHSNSKLKLDENMTFSYDPIFVASKDLLEFEDDSAKLLMRSATLHTTVTGMNLTKGAIDIRGNCNFSSEVEAVDDFTIIDEGITFGDRNSANDLYLSVCAGSSLNLLQGSINYKNVSENSLFMFNEASRWCITNNTGLNLFENLPLRVGHLELHSGAEIRKKVAGTEVIGSMFFVE